MYYRVASKRPQRGYSIGNKRPHIELGIGKKTFSTNFDIGLRKLSNSIKKIAPLAAVSPEALPYAIGALGGAVLIDQTRPLIKKGVRTVEKRLGY